MALGKNIKAILDYRDIAQRQFAEEIGWTAQGLWALINRDSGKSDWLATIAKHLAIPESALLDENFTAQQWGKNNTYPLPAKIEGHASESTSPYLSARMIRIVGTAQLGDNGHWVPIDHTEHAEFVLYTGKDPDAYALRCKGFSMKPRIQENEVAIIEPNHPTIAGDEVLLNAKDGRVMIKKYLYTRDGQMVLISVNEAFPPVSISVTDIENFHYVANTVKADAVISQ